MAEATRQEKLKRITVEHIDGAYRAGQITAGDRNKLMREKAHSTVAGVLEEEGFVKAIFTQTIKHIQEGWDNLKSGLVVEPGKAPGAREGLTALWGSIQVLTSAVSAIGEVTGQQMENWALRAGASPGVARVINIASDVATGFIPVGVTVRTGVKGVQAIQKAGKAKAAVKVAATADKGAEAAQVAASAIAKGLEVEGAKDAARIVSGGVQAAEKGVVGKQPWEMTRSQVERSLKLRNIHGDKALDAIDLADELASKGAEVANDGFVTLYHRTTPDAAMKIVKTGKMVSKEDRLFFGTHPEGQIEGYGESVVKVRLPIERLQLNDLFTGEAHVTLKGTSVPVKAEIWSSTGEGVAKIVTPVLSVQEQFMADFTRFHKEMSAITETQSHEQTAKLASKLGLSLDDLKNVIPGQALDERQMFAYLKALEPQVDQLFTLARAVKDGTEASAHTFARFASDFFTLSPKFRGAEVTAGRSVEILKEVPPMKKITDMLMGWSPEDIAKGDFVGAMQTMAEDVVAMADQPDKAKALAVLAQTGWQRFKENGWPMLREGYINLLLARPITQVRNFLGNSIAAVNSVLERQTGAVFSIDKEAGLVGKEGVYLFKGMMAALGDGLKAFGSAFKTIDPADVSRFDFVPHAIPGVMGKIINAPVNTTGGMDNFFKTILTRGSYYAQALREGAQAGHDGTKLADFVARRVNHPTEAMVKEGSEFALTQTFQNDLGTIGTAARALQTGPLSLWFPFMKTPINLAKYAWNRTPGLQLISKSLYDDIAAGGAKADLAIGRLTFSNLMGMFLFELAKDGMITGSGPVDPALRRAWLATHQPYSIKTNEGWLPISNAEPGSTMFGMTADYAQVLNQLDQPSAEQGAMAIAFTAMRNLADKTYWKTLSDLIDLTSATIQGHEPGKRAKDVLMNPVVTVATGGPLVASIAKAVDPISRETRGFVDNLMARVPGYSTTLPPLRDGYGDPILPPQAVGPDWLGVASPLTLKPIETDRVKVEGAKLEVKLPKFPDHVGGTTRDDFDIRAPFPEDRVGVELTPQERDRWQVIYRDLLRSKEHGIEIQLLDNPEYQQQTRAMQREMFMSTLAGYRSTARDALTVENTELGKRMLSSQATHLLPMLQGQDRADAERQISESLTLFDSMAPEMRDNLLRYGILQPEEATK